ncbi:MAG: glycosyltransferase family 8 protein [Bacillota bacterium]|nr:glycosyltransferase family 8 protein [Bacillota bacterium]
MNILLSFNSNYYMPALVLLKSLLVNNQWCREIRVYVLYADLKTEEIQRFSQVAEESGIAKAIFLPVGPDKFKDAPLHLKWISRETYYRLLAQEMLPESVERVLYLDVDMVVMGSLEEFYHQDFEGKLLVACNRHGPGGVGPKRLEQLTLPRDTIYFNAGTLLYDLSGQRREIDPNILYEYPVLFYKQLKYGDQDVLNAVFYGLTKFADYRVYNCFDHDISRQRQEDRVRRSCKIFHFNGNGKPWTEMYWGRMAWLFWEYAQQLPEYAGQYEALKDKQLQYKKKRTADKAKATRQKNRQKAEQEKRKEEEHENEN